MKINLTKKLICLFFITIFSLAALTLSAQEQENAQSQPQPTITLVWSTDTYVPANYRGKALPTRNSQVEVVAIAENLPLEAEKALYEWTLDRDHHLEKKLNEKGRQTFIFNIGNTTNHLYSVQLTIRDEEDKIVAQSPSLNIRPIEPQIVLRADQKTASWSDLKNKKYQIASNQTIRFFANPYFFSVKNISQLNYAWKFDNQTAAQEKNDEDPNVFELKIGQVAERLVKKVELSAENTNNLIQRAAAQAELILNP